MIQKCLFLSFLLVISVVQDSNAAERKPPKTKLVDPSEITSVDVTIKISKKTSKVYTVQCFKGAAGKAKTAKKNMMQFKSFAKLQSESKRPKQVALYKSLKTAGKKACTNPETPKTPGLPETPKDGDPPVVAPDAFSLEAYKGPFGENEARILFNRFAFAGSPQDIADAVARGLEATVAKLTTYQPEPVVDGIVEDIRRDSWRTDDPEAGNQNKFPPYKLNDYSRTGIRIAWLHRMQITANPFFERVKFFIHDERLSVADTAARDCERHAIKTYLDDIDNVALTGDYRRYSQAMLDSQLMHLRWLDGASNLGGVAPNRPNENMAREALELKTTGPTSLNGENVYSDLDIAQLSRAFTGFQINTVTIDDAQVCLASRVPLLHTPGMKVIFNGTPYQTEIDTDVDFIAAVFKHPRTAEHLAEDIWKEFINDKAPAGSLEGIAAIKALAKVIEDNHHNLLPVFRTVMLSKAMFAADSRNSLLKHPVERVIGFLRVTNYPLNYRRLDELMARLEQQPLRPPTVFGWNPQKLIDDSRMLSWRNAVTDYFMNINIEELKEDTGYSYYDRFVKDLHDQGKRTARDVIDRVSRELGVQLNEAQKAKLDDYMNYYYSTYQCPSQCNGQPFKAVRDIFDTSPDAEASGVGYNGQRKIRGLLTIVTGLPQYLYK